MGLFSVDPDLKTHAGVTEYAQLTLLQERKGCCPVTTEYSVTDVIYIQKYRGSISTHFNNVCVSGLFIPPGINEQARKLQKSRSRVTSTLIERTTGRNHKLWRSKSEKNLLESDTVNKQDADHNKCRKDPDQVSVPIYEEPKTSSEQSHIHSLSEGDRGSRAKTETLCPSIPRGEREGEESEKEETESSDDNNTQYSIHPPHDCPYLLLLQGCSPAQVSHSITICTLCNCSD